MCGTCSCALPSRPAPQTPATPGRHLRLAEALLQRNDRQAAANRTLWRAAGLPVLNLMAAPGAGKTTLLEALAGQWPRGGASTGTARAAPMALAAPPALAALVGDLATDRDALRLQAAGWTAQAINTGQACHLEAAGVAQAVARLERAGVALAALDLLVIENVGNLVCPAAYDLGETARVVLLSVTEGEDKPLKYPPAFRRANLVLISKSDLAPLVALDRALLQRSLAEVAPQATVLTVSARTGQGLPELVQWLQALG